MNQRLFWTSIIFHLFALPLFASESLTISVTLTTTNPRCGKANGRIVVTAGGGVAPYTYSINGGTPQSNNVFIFLNPGTYNITVTDATSQSGSATTTLVNQFSPPTGVTWTTTPTSGCAIPDASLTLTGAGGTTPYTYSIDRTNYQVGNLFPNLYAGSYWAAVKDANGCLSPFVLLTANINEQCAIHQNGTNQTSICFPYRSHLALINVSGGTPPYLYSLDGTNFQANNDFFPLSAGLYTVTVKDAAGLILKFNVALQNPCPDAFIVLATTTPANCGANGTINVLASEGVPPYTYSLDGINFQVNSQFTGLTPGNYTVTVKDADGVLASGFCIVKDQCLNVTAITTNSTCGNNNGSIQAQASGGVLPYQYALGGNPFSSNNLFNNLSAGTYTVNAIDAIGATASVNVTVTNIPGPVINSVAVTPASCSSANGTITISSQNGTAPFQYSINGVNFQGSPVFNGLASGNYVATVMDANGCNDTRSVNVSLNNTLYVTIGSGNTICEGQSTTLNATSNGTRFSWSPTTGLNNPNILSPVASPVDTTNYTLTATLGPCTATGSTTVAVIKSPVPIAGADISICFGENAQLGATGGMSYLWSPVTYLDDPFLPNPTVINPPAGRYRYSVTVADNSGCSSLIQAFINVDVFSMQVYAGSDTLIEAGQQVRLHSIDVNNAGFINYLWSPPIGLDNPSSANPTTVLNNDITYLLTATSAIGCIAKDEITIKVFHEIDIFVPSAFTPNKDGLNDILKAIPVGIKYFKSFTVFDRAGQVVFKTTNTTFGWDGNCNGTPMYGLFIWTAEGIGYNGNVIRRKGTVTIIR